MTCQLAYQATGGSSVYSKPLSSGDCTLRLDKRPANWMVIAVTSNTDYIYRGESTRKAHYDHRLQQGESATGLADFYTPWYDTGAIKVTLKSTGQTIE